MDVNVAGVTVSGAVPGADIVGGAAEVGVDIGSAGIVGVGCGVGVGIDVGAGVAVRAGAGAEAGVGIGVGIGIGVDVDFEIVDPVEVVEFCGAVVTEWIVDAVLA